MSLLFRINNIPVIIGGRDISSIVIGSLYVLKKIVKIIPRIMNEIPPIISYFHAKMINAIRMKLGIKCIRNPIPGVSKANILMNRTKSIDNTLGAQCRIFL